jgi:excisionase family DNA binding protein
MATAEEFLTVGQVADLFHVNVATVHRWCDAGELPEPAQIGRKLLFKADEIRAAVELSRAKRLRW